jgi:hypothetical protein
MAGNIATTQQVPFTYHHQRADTLDRQQLNKLNDMPTVFLKHILSFSCLLMGCYNCSWHIDSME